jgi:hypothetical protein
MAGSFGIGLTDFAILGVSMTTGRHLATWTGETITN